jgi:protein TonB
MRALLRSTLFHLAILASLALVGILRPEAPVEVPVELTSIKIGTPSSAKTLKQTSLRQKSNTPSFSPSSESQKTESLSSSTSVANGANEGGPVSEEYDVTELPVLLNEVRVPYPPAARAKRLQGPVVFDLIVSSQGEVSSFTVAQTPGPELTESASMAIRKFRFKPARQDDKPVAIRIRYTYRFTLE